MCDLNFTSRLISLPSYFWPMSLTLFFANLDSVRKKNSFISFLILILFLIVGSTNSFGSNNTSRYTTSVDASMKEHISTLEKSHYRPLSECKMQESEVLDSASNMFRTGITNLDPKELIRVIIFFVDFSDQVSPPLYTPNLKPVTDQISTYFEAISNGYIHFKWVQEKLTSRMPKSLADYGTGSRLHSNQSVQIIRDAQEIAFKTYPRKEFDYFMVVSPPDISHSQLSTSLSLLQSESELINSTILANDFWSSGKSWTIPAHEIGHALGLLDLYNYESAEHVKENVSQYLKQFQYMKYFDLMNWPTGPAPEMSAWSRWEIGALRSEQVRCLPRLVTETNLEALESQALGIKALFLKINEYQMIVMENRQAIGFDQALPISARGVILYLVNLREKSGLGPLRLIYPILSKDKASSLALPVHEIQTVGDYQIECLGYSKFQARIRVSGSSHPE